LGVCAFTRFEHVVRLSMQVLIYDIAQTCHETIVNSAKLHGLKVRL
jgi:hypothetical protein